MKKLTFTVSEYTANSILDDLRMLGNISTLSGGRRYSSYRSSDETELLCAMAVARARAVEYLCIGWDSGYNVAGLA